MFKKDIRLEMCCKLIDESINDDHTVDEKYKEQGADRIYKVRNGENVVIGWITQETEINGDITCMMRFDRDHFIDDYVI
ncbi:hypothetical protein ACFLZV_01435 [Candidatus Margulisiibacteriota bacterium]